MDGSSKKAPVTPRGEQTRQKLLAAAEAEFGERGFHTASVSSITTRAGVAQGTFYIYYSSKEEIMWALVEHMSSLMRHALTESIEGINDRLEAELTGFETFLKFALEHKNLYRIVLESQFVDEAIHKKYYQRLSGAYTKRLEEAQAAGQINKQSPETQAWLLMGMAYFIGMRYPLWEDKMPPRDVIETSLEFIKRGLTP